MGMIKVRQKRGQGLYVSQWPNFERLEPIHFGGIDNYPPEIHTGCCSIFLRPQARSCVYFYYLSVLSIVRQ
jgi:hypothetical protein